MRNARDLMEMVSRDTLPRSRGLGLVPTVIGLAGSEQQSLWLATIMRYHIQPAVETSWDQQTVSWHAFRRTYSTLLHANGENVKVVQELLQP